MRYKEVDILKGIAIFLVLLGHAIIYFPVNLHEIKWCEYLFMWLSCVHMPLFFLMSGFCWSFRGGYGGYVLKKAKRLIVPYLVFSVIDLVPRALLPELVNRDKSVTQSIADVLLRGGEYWFLYALFVIFLIFPLIDLAVKKLPAAKWIFFILFAAAAASGIEIGIFTLTPIIKYLFYFFAGYLAKKSMPALRRLYSFAVSHRAVSFAVCVLSALLWCGATYILCELVDVQALRFVSGLLGVFFFVSAVCLNGKSPLLTPFAEIGKYSLQLYLFNGVLLTVARTVIVKLLGVTAAVPVIAFNMLVTLGISYIVIKFIVEKVKIFRFLCGIN